jgi:amidase
VTATDNPAWVTDLIYGDHFIFGTSGLAGGPGYPIVQVPAGMVFGVPFGISFFGTAFSEPTLIKLASGYEAATQVRAHNPPTFAATAPFDHTQGPLQQGGGSAQAATTAPTNSAQATAATAAVSPTSNPPSPARVGRLPRHL